jgi:hypothetical protein
MNVAKRVVAVTVVVAAAMSPALAVPQYSASTSCGTALLNQAAPTTVSEACADAAGRGSADFEAIAGTGTLGARANSIRGGFADGVPVGGSALARFQDTFTVTWDGPGPAPGSVFLRAYLNLDGAMEVLGTEGWAASEAAVNFSFFMGGDGNLLSYVLRNPPTPSAAASNFRTVGGGTSQVGKTLLVDVTLESSLVWVPVGVPTNFVMWLEASAGTRFGNPPADAGKAHAAFSSFGSTASFAPGRNVFGFFDASGNPLDGFTANAGDYLVNNRFVIGDDGDDGGSHTVPEPGSLALLGIGMLGLMVARTGRRSRRYRQPMTS